MKIFDGGKKALSWAFLFALASACSSRPVVQDYPETASPTEETQHFERDLGMALNKQFDVLSPYNFEEARLALNDAKTGLERQYKPKDILHRVAEGRAYLDRAQKAADLSHTNMEEVVESRQRAKLAGAHAHFPKEFARVDERLTDVTSDLESSDTKSAQRDRTKLQAQYLDLELRALKQSHLSPARELVEQAKREGAESYAPRTLAIAEKSIVDADAFITGNRQDTDQVKARSQVAVAAAEHALKITRAAKSTGKASTEEMALQLEEKQNAIANAEDINQSLSAEKMSLSEQKQKMEADQKLAAKFEDARKAFSDQEAEVYRQGNELRIRLKSLEFPSKQAVLKGSNFPVLSKVQKIVKDFGDQSTVVIEGHTDSVGGKLLNERISEARAKAVRDYLVSNEAIEDARIHTVGYGFQKPLASNKTAEGRAQNRRVDVVIQVPQAEQHSAQ